MTKSATVSEKLRKLHSPAFLREVLKIAEGIAIAARERCRNEPKLYASAADDNS